MNIRAPKTRSECIILAKIILAQLSIIQGHFETAYALCELQDLQNRTTDEPRK